MKLFYEAFKLILFFIGATGIYLYATEKIKISSPYIPSQAAYTIWKNIEKIEDNWYTKGEKMQVAAFSTQDKEDLLNSTQKYLELKDPIDELIKTRENKDYEQFLKKKK